MSIQATQNSSLVDQVPCKPHLGCTIAVRVFLITFLSFSQANSERRFTAVQVPDVFPVAVEGGAALSRLSFVHGDFGVLYR